MISRRGILEVHSASVNLVDGGDNNTIESAWRIRVVGFMGRNLITTEIAGRSDLPLHHPAGHCRRSVRPAWILSQNKLSVRTSSCQTNKVLLSATDLGRRSWKKGKHSVRHMCYSYSATTSSTQSDIHIGAYRQLTNSEQRFGTVFYRILQFRQNCSLGSEDA